ncbi:MAG: class I SAM-dependent methyltransferase [Deltaproteobacteria bacterium]|nr:class I SAM-dependent methyltransferase [Deltaproteobacteria bacterium]
MSGGLIVLGLAAVLSAQPAAGPEGLDGRVSRFLEEARSSWSAWNVPYEDGKILYDLVLRNRFRTILEIGTSTGHSTIWLAWAASNTGGKVTTVEIDRGRYEKALVNFRKAGVAAYIEARLGDAHELVPLLPGPFDFIFCDADKDWYGRYFQDLKDKLAPGGCFAAHNVLWAGDPHVRNFLEQVRRAPGFRTTIERGSGEGISVSCKETRGQKTEIREQNRTKSGYSGDSILIFNPDLCLPTSDL